MNIEIFTPRHPRFTIRVFAVHQTAGGQGMAANFCQNCRVEYRVQEIVISGPAREAREEAQRIIQRFACSAVPYRLASAGVDQIVLRPA